MNFKELKEKIRNDFKYYSKSQSLGAILFSLYFNLEFKLLLNYRISRYLYKNRTIFKFLLPFYIKRQRIRYSCQISPKAEIGENFKIMHANGILLGLVKIGNNVTIYQQVTIGYDGRRKDAGKSAPVIEDNVKIFAGAKIIGPITIGHDSVIGVNAVVKKSVPPYTLVVTGETKKITNEDLVRFL